VTHFLLIRHAETDMAGRFCGHSDPELNERGRRQLGGLVNTLSEYAIQRVYTSDLRRALQTAGAIAEHFEAELRVRPGLREIHFGQWEGLSWNEIEMRDPAFAKSWVAAYPNVTAPGGESFQQFQARVRREIAFLLAEATESPIAVVAHAGFIRVVLTSLYEVSEQEAWNRTNEYGTVVVLDTNLIDKGAMDKSDCWRF
jgi:alpha-ribazole phosphatase